MRALVSDGASLAGKRIVARLQTAGWDVTDWNAAGGAADTALQGLAALILTDPLADQPDPGLLPRLSGLLTAAAAAGVGRIVLLGSAGLYRPAISAAATLDESSPVRLAADDAGGPGAGAELTLALEALLQALPGPSGRVALRVPLVFGPRSPAAQALVEHVLETGTLPPGFAADPSGRLCGIDAEDLAEAVLLAATRPVAMGHAFNLAADQAVPLASAQAEILRLADLLSDQHRTEIQVRPEHPQGLPVLATGKAAHLLGFRPRKTLYAALAEQVQAAIQRRRADGRLPALRPLMPAVLVALERRETPLQGRVAVVTGATAGIGRATALLLARLGARVVAVGRDEAAGASLLAEIAGCGGTLPAEFLRADLASQREVRALAATLAARHPAIGILIHAAGAAFPERRLTEDGIEATLAVNLLAPFLLTNLLAAPLRAAAWQEGAAQDGAGGRGAQVLAVICAAHHAAAPDLADLQSALSYDAFTAYGRAKSGLVMLTYCLAAQMQGSGLTANAVDPGEVRTDFVQRNGLDAPAPGSAPLGPQAQQRLQTRLDAERAQMASPFQAACHLADPLVDPDAAGANGLCLVQGVVQPSAAATYDEAAAWALWQACSRLTGQPDAALPDAVPDPAAPDPAVPGAVMPASLAGG